jgi:hypothetical protein
MAPVGAVAVRILPLLKREGRLPHQRTVAKHPEIGH